jgi:hypothetical protein
MKPFPLYLQMISSYTWKLYQKALRSHKHILQSSMIQNQYTKNREHFYIQTMNWERNQENNTIHNSFKN